MRHVQISAEWMLAQVMDLHLRAGRMEASLTEHARRLDAMDKKKTEAPQWLKRLPVSELLLLGFLIFGGLVLHLTPEDWRAIIMAKAGVK